jgi:hypothetical protein
LPELACLGGVYRVDAAAAERMRSEHNVFDVWTIDGSVVNNRERFFSALAVALEFPGYFGHNWDATYDCLTDLAGGDGTPAAVVITHGDLFLAGMGTEWKTAQRVFTDAAVFWQGRDRVLLFIMAFEGDFPGVPALPLTWLE